VLVACSSGVSANRPTIVIFAKEERAGALENARAVGRELRRARRRRREEDMVILVGLRVDIEVKRGFVRYTEVDLRFGEGCCGCCGRRRKWVIELMVFGMSRSKGRDLIGVL